MSNTNNNLQTQTSNALHSAIMEAGGKYRPPMLGHGNYVQWKSRIKRYIDTKPNNERIHYCLKNPSYKFKWAERTIPIAKGSFETTTEGYMENYKNVQQDIINQLDAEVVQIILTGIDNDIYSTVDACPNACEMWKAIERLKQGESINKIYKPTNNNLRTSSNTSRANQDNILRINRGTGYDNQRTINIAGAKENVGTQVVHQSRIQCYNYKEYRHVARECQKPKQAKDAAYHKEKMLLCKQEIQEVTPDVADNSGPIFDAKLLQKLVEIILFIVESGFSKYMTGNLKLLSNFVEKFLGTVKFGNDQIASILGYEDLVQENVTIKKVYYVEGLNHSLFSVGQFCDADLEVTFRKSTCYIHDLKGNDILTGFRGTDLYSITLQDTSTPNPICLMAKASSSQSWLWHHRLSHLNFDTINLLLKYDIVTGLPKLKFVKDHLCSSCELGKEKRKSFKI
ncbi:retrovirus-related pol polyprotein from transposon TNT 1-94 [Tanacetum coccineum]